MAEELTDTIELDSDTQIEDGKNYGSLYPYDPVYTEIEIAESPFTVFEYLRQLKKGKIIVQPDFQRNQVWKNAQKSKFIESILLNFPLPPIYLNETREAKYIVIDGLQRTTALDEFYSGIISLTDLEALPKYNGKTFQDLPETLRSKFEDKKLTIFVLKPSTPMVVIYDLFNRINTGGTQLNKQEVRNCIFIGNATELLKELSEQPYFREAIDNGIKDTRMKDREAVLRYLAFRWYNYQKEYNGDMSEYIETAMKSINKIENENKLKEMKSDFEKVMKWSFKIWGNRNFRIPTEKSRGTINIAILESVCNYLASKEDEFIKKNENQIERNYFELIKNKTYCEAVTNSTGNKAKVFDRFRLAFETLNKNTV